MVVFTGKLIHGLFTTPPTDKLPSIPPTNYQDMCGGPFSADTYQDSQWGTKQSASGFVTLCNMTGS